MVGPPSASPSPLRHGGTRPWRGGGSFTRLPLSLQLLRRDRFSRPLQAAGSGHRVAGDRPPDRPPRHLYIFFIPHIPLPPPPPLTPSRPQKLHPTTNAPHRTPP